MEDSLTVPVANKTDNDLAASGFKKTKSNLQASEINRIEDNFAVPVANETDLEDPKKTKEEKNEEDNDEEVVMDLLKLCVTPRGGSLDEVTTDGNWTKWTLFISVIVSVLLAMMKLRWALKKCALSVAQHWTQVRAFHPKKQHIHDFHNPVLILDSIFLVH